MNSESNNSLNFTLPPLQNPYEMTLKDLSLTSSPYPRDPLPPPDPPDQKLLKKLQLTSDDLDDSSFAEHPKKEERPKFEPEPELEDLAAHLEDVPTVSYTSDTSHDIIADFNREIESNKRHQGSMRARTQEPCPECLQYLRDHEDYPLDDFEEMNVSVRSPSTNRDKIKEQLKDLQADLKQFQDTCPAAAGIPVTTPRRSVYPKRPMSFNPDREPDISFLPEVHSTPKHQYCTRKKPTPKSSQNVRFSKPDTCCYVSAPQGFPALGSNAKSFKSGIPKPIRKCPVTDLRKSYSNKNQLKKHDNSKNHRTKKPVRVKDQVATILCPELTTILPHRPMHKVVSEVFEGGLEECEIFVTTPETIVKENGKKTIPNTHAETQCKLIASGHEKVAPITSRSLLHIPKLISDVESLIKEKIEINYAKALDKDKVKTDFEYTPLFTGSRSTASYSEHVKKEQALNESLAKLGISLPVHTVLVQYEPKKLAKSSKGSLQQAMVDSLSNCLANNTKTKLARSKTASTIFQLNGGSLVDKADVWRTKQKSTSEDIRKKQYESFESLPTKLNTQKKVVFKQFTIKPLENTNSFLDIQPLESKKSFDIKDIPRSYFIIGQTPTVPQRNFKCQMPSITKIKRTASKLRNKTVLSKMAQNQDVKFCCNKSTSWSSLSTYKDTTDEATSANNNIASRFSSKRLNSPTYERFKKLVQFPKPSERPVTPKLPFGNSRTLYTHPTSRPLSAQKTLESFVLETNVKLSNKGKPSKRNLDNNPSRFQTKILSRPNSPPSESQQNNTNADVEKHKKLGYSLPQKQVTFKSPLPKEKVVSNSKYYKMMQLNKCPKIRPENTRKNIMSKLSDIEKSILPWIDSKNKENKSSLTSKKTKFRVEALTARKSKVIGHEISVHTLK